VAVASAVPRAIICTPAPYHSMCKRNLK